MTLNFLRDFKLASKFVIRSCMILVILDISFPILFIWLLFIFIFIFITYKIIWMMQNGVSIPFTKEWFPYRPSLQLSLYKEASCLGHSHNHHYYDKQKVIACWNHTFPARPVPCLFYTKKIVLFTPFCIIFTTVTCFLYVFYNYLCNHNNISLVTFSSKESHILTLCEDTLPDCIEAWEPFPAKLNILGIMIL